MGIGVPHLLPAHFAGRTRTSCLAEKLGGHFFSIRSFSCSYYNCLSSYVSLRFEGRLGSESLRHPILEYLITADCARDIPIAVADTYVASQTAGQLGNLSNYLPTDYKYQENNKASTVTTGVLSTTLKINHQKPTADVVACASYTELILTSQNPYVIGTQLRHTADGKNVTSIDTIAATTGALSFNAAKTLGYIEKEDWSPLDASKQSTRAVLQAAGSVYLDMWSSAYTYSAVPWGTPCERVEGSSLNSPCTNGAPKGGSTNRNSMRRYVIDESLGSVDIHCAFSAVGGVADSHEFRLEGEKLRFVHTITL